MFYYCCAWKAVSCPGTRNMQYWYRIRDSLKSTVRGGRPSRGFLPRRVTNGFWYVSVTMLFIPRMYLSILLHAMVIVPAPFFIMLYPFSSDGFWSKINWAIIIILLFALQQYIIASIFWATASYFCVVRGVVLCEEQISSATFWKALSCSGPKLHVFVMLKRGLRGDVSSASLHENVPAGWSSPWICVDWFCT